MKEIKLTKGMVAKVSDEDYEELSKSKWSFDRYAYRTVAVGNGRKRSVRMHRQIMNPPKGMVVDHINGDKLDNTRENLRVVTQSENVMNRKGNPRSSTGLYGVYWDNSKKKWRAQIRHCIIGRFDSPELAAVAYNEFVTKNGWVAPLNEGVVTDAR